MRPNDWACSREVGQEEKNHKLGLANRPIPWMEEPGGLQSMGSLRVGHDWVTSLSLFTFMHWRRKWQPTPVFLPETPRDGGAWWAAVYGVAQSRTQLKWLSSSNRPMLAKKQELEPCMKQLTGSGLRKEYDKAVYCHLVYLTYTQSTLWEMSGWMSFKLESKLPGEITTSDMRMIPL